jgi:ABC-2 type transport system ATP-binding protein
VQRSASSRYGVVIRIVIPLLKILSNLLKSGITILMTTPYLDEAERCTRVAMMNYGKMLVADSPQNLKKMLQGTIVELVCAEIRRASSILKENPLVREIQAFGDRLNILVDDESKDVQKIIAALKKNEIEVMDHRTVSPSLENIFISLLSGKGAGQVTEGGIVA